MYKLLGSLSRIDTCQGSLSKEKIMSGQAFGSVGSYFVSEVQNPGTIPDFSEKLLYNDKRKVIITKS